MGPPPAFESSDASRPTEPATSAECEVHDNVAVQVGHGNVQHIHQAADNDVGLVIKYESEKIKLDRDNRFYLEITNRTSTPKRLILAIEGVRDTVVKVVPDNTVELPGLTMVERVFILRCTQTHPMAGSVPLQVVVMEADTGRVRFQSDQVRVTVPPRPVLASELAPPKQVPSTARYVSAVRLTNTGNTELHGTLRVPRDRPGCLSATHVHLGTDRFDLSPGERTEIPAELTFPDRGWNNRAWVVLVNAEVEDDEKIGSSVRARCEVTQYGIWSILRRYVVNLPRRLTEWGGQRAQMRRGWLVGAGLLLLAAGVLVGQVVASTSPGPATEPPPATPMATEAHYTKMPCETGTFVASLKSLTEDDALAHGKWLVDSESARLRNLATSTPDLQKYKVQASRREDICPAALDTLKPGEKYTVFLWVGPVPEAEATMLCTSLGKKVAYDCLRLPTA